MSERSIMHASDYRGRPVNICDGREFSPFPAHGCLCLKVLPMLNGKRWDDIALGYVHSLRPSRIRVIEHGQPQQCDGRSWRVTVQLAKDNLTIKHIVQEVDVGLPDGIRHGNHLETAMALGADSPEAKWEAASCRMVCWDHGETYKILEDGTKLPYPTRL